jgi:tetratricopeptide (TPR) repeat protein
LELFISVCNAVQHAHQKGIIHRDLKPSNVLVAESDHRPAPQVIDFGIAKLLDQTLAEKTIVTRWNQLLGTLDYMSPEQTKLGQLDVDTRSDVYSLGVLLYELLTGTTPLDKKRLKSIGFDQAIQIIREEEPHRPSARVTAAINRLALAVNRKLDPRHFAKLLRGDLDWIVMKCLDKDRNRRYETANSLARDIERYLHDEPVQACPPSTRYRLQKFVRGNKSLVMAMSLIVLTLVAGVIGTTWGLIRAEKHRLVIEEQRNDLAQRNQALQAAHEHEQLLKERARQAIESVTSDTAIDLLTREKELRPEQEEFLDKMIQYYAESIDEEAATEEEQSRRAQAYHRMGRLNLVLGRPQDSKNAYRRAVALGKQLAADFPHRPEFLYQLASSQNALGVRLRVEGRSSEAESAYVEAKAILKQLAADFPNRREFRQALAGVLNNLGILLYDSGQLTDAENAHAEALAIRKQLAADFPDDLVVRRALAMSHSNFGWMLQTIGKRNEAQAALTEAVALQRQVVGRLPNQPDFRLDLGRYLFNLGHILAENGRPKEAEAARAEGLVIFKQLVVDFPNRPEFHQELAQTMGQKSQPAVEEQRLTGGSGGARGEGEEELRGDPGDSDLPTNSRLPKK